MPLVRASERATAAPSGTQDRNYVSSQHNPRFSTSNDGDGSLCRCNFLLKGNRRRSSSHMFDS